LLAIILLLKQKFNTFSANVSHRISSCISSYNPLFFNKKEEQTIIYSPVYKLYMFNSCVKTDLKSFHFHQHLSSLLTELLEALA
jgi:hypothetical protein